jgi:tetratricopeptide (TPR) repeat protein
MSPRLAKRVLLIGWDAADWQIINPLLEAGLMPTLDAFVNQGVIGNLGTLQPILSPMLWNSIATGKRPYKHGIHGFVEIKPDGSGIRPVMSTSRQSKALWNIFTQAQLKSQVFSWFASHPAEPIDGVCVSNWFPQPSQSPNEWPLPEGSVHPTRLGDALKNLRVHPTEIEGCHLQPFIPRASEIDQNDPSARGAFTRLAHALAECASVHAAATWTIEHEPWDFCAVYFNAIDRVCHDFMTFHPPRRGKLDNRWFNFFRDVVNGIYRFHDMMLERLLQLAGPDTTVIILSDHGFYNDHLRPRQTPKTPLGPVAWHRPYGIVAMRGPGILNDERIYGASILDIAPTVLTLFGLPVGQDMDGKVLVDAFVDPPGITTIPSWEDVPGDAGIHPTGAVEAEPDAAKQALQQLIDLGYVAPPSEQEQTTIDNVRVESRFNLAVSLLDADLSADAIPLLETLQQEKPQDRFGLTLAQAYLNVRRLPEARHLLQTLATSPNDELPAGNQSETANGESNRPRNARLKFLLGVLAFEEGKVSEALAHLNEAEAADEMLPRLHNQLGFIYLRCRRWADAERAFRRALEIDGDNARACHGLSVALLRSDRYAEAADLSLRAVGLQHFFPAAHFQLGLILTRLNWPERAAQAFETGLKMRPNSVVGHRYLSRLYARLGQDAKARSHRATATALRAQSQLTLR